MGRKVFDFTLRGSGPEFEALVAFLTTYKNGDVRKYNEFIRNALMSYFTHISYCESVVKEGGYPLPHLPFGNVNPASSSITGDYKTETVHRSEVSHEHAIQNETIKAPNEPHVEAAPYVHNGTGSKGVIEAEKAANEMSVSDDDIVVTMDASLGSILALDDDIP